jgi:hypothetical protein
MCGWGEAAFGHDSCSGRYVNFFGVHDYEYNVFSSDGWHGDDGSDNGHDEGSENDR